MKKLISLLLVAGLMLSVFVMPASVFAADLDFLVAESYNNLPTGSAPEGAVSAGAAKVKVVEEGKEKAVELSGAKVEMTAPFTITT